MSENDLKQRASQLFDQIEKESPKNTHKGDIFCNALLYANEKEDYEVLAYISRKAIRMANNSKIKCNDKTKNFFKEIQKIAVQQIAQKDQKPHNFI